MVESPLVAFYRGRAADRKGRTFDEIVAWDDDRLEGVHDWVQWLFPTREPSMYHADAPVLVDEDVAAFRADAGLRACQIVAFRRVLRFLGFAGTVEAGRPRIDPDPAIWDERKPEWLFPDDHNHLRISRVLASLAILGSPEHARAFHEALERLCSTEEGRRNVTPRTRAFWAGAAIAE